MKWLEKIANSEKIKVVSSLVTKKLESPWLKKNVITQMKVKHKELFDSLDTFTIKQVLNFISGSAHWWVISLTVILIFSLSSIINIDFLNFLEIKPQTAVYIVDQRTGNIATIISITLVVVGFLINNLAVKSPLVYRLLFQKSFLYPIIYLILTTIACFIVASTLRDTIPEYMFSRIVLAGTYLSILILFLIGFLFRVVFLFSNVKNIEKMIEEELMKEAKENMKQILLQIYCAEKFTACMIENGAKEFDFMDIYDSPNQRIEIKEISNDELLKREAKEQIIKDINLYRISRLIKEKKNFGKILYSKINIDTPINVSNNFMWVDGMPYSEKDKKKLHKCLRLKKELNYQKDPFEMRKYFDQKLEELCEKNNYRDLELVLKTLTRLYEFQMQYQV